MRNLIWLAFACLSVLAPNSAIGRSAGLDAHRWPALLAAAREYAQDRTLIFYCFRRSKEVVPFLYAGLHGDIEDALQRLRAAGASDRQSAEVVEAVLGNVHFADRDTSDAGLDKECTAKEVEKNVQALWGVGLPLSLRHPFDQLKP
jgi:hypothetical protein